MGDIPKTGRKALHLGDRKSHCLFCHEIPWFPNPELEPSPAPTLVSSSRQKLSLRPAQSQPVAFSQQAHLQPQLTVKSLSPWLGLRAGREAGVQVSWYTPGSLSLTCKVLGTVSLKSPTFLSPLSPSHPRPQKDFTAPLGTRQRSPWGGLRGQDGRWRVEFGSRFRREKILERQVTQRTEGSIM